MGKAIVVGAVVVLVLLILAGVWIWTKRHDFKGDLSQGEERYMRELVSEAAMIFTAMQMPRGYSVQDMDLLSPTTSQEVAQWMDKYQKNRKEFERA